MRAGLIPSKALQERKIIHERLSMTDQKKKCKLKCVHNISNQNKIIIICSHYIFFVNTISLLINK